MLIVLIDCIFSKIFIYDFSNFNIGHYYFRYQPIVLDFEQFILSEMSQAMGSLTKKCIFLSKMGPKCPFLGSNMSFFVGILQSFYKDKGQ